MKKYLLILLVVVSIGCSSRIKVYLDPALSSEGVEVWNQNVKYVDFSTLFKPDITIIYRPDIKLTGEYGYRILGKCMDNGGNDLKILYIFTNNSLVLAHEFGHALGYGHSENSNSIMYPYIRLENLDRPLGWFIEFQ